ncbi:hypothetical protein GH714_006119 [Hevea brasiliensis]|uniref:Pentacotripeptide-repeat region of PRORP domain-containing protein n=1 Tax=Hevea brasiliensis TaxID=3981 RepID=A0A6A6NFW6_HEVBR|nr:hypothetical protein GH714_006119 [Hevea brasiliensis]
MGLHLFRQMSERSIVSWNIMISCLAQSGRDSEALGLFHEMKDQGFNPDDATLVIVLPICARLGAVEVGQWIQSYAESSVFFRDSVSVGNALVDFHSKCGVLETAKKVFNEMPQKSVISWNAMISAMAFNGKGELGIELFEEMTKAGICPNDATFVAVLSSCAHAGEAYDLIRSMPEKPNASLWGSLLGACRTHGDMELAQLAVEELVNLEPWNSGNYVLLSNIYAEEERWDKVEEVRTMMKERSIEKTPGRVQLDSLR